jgi:hypothetical protein
MEVNVLCIVQAFEQGQLLNISSFGAAVVNLYAVPTVRRLRSVRGNSFFDRVEPIVCPERKWSCGWWIMT